MKIWIDENEWYPVYSFDTSGAVARYRNVSAEISEETHSRFEKAFEEFDLVQKELHRLANESLEQQERQAGA